VVEAVDRIGGEGCDLGPDSPEGIRIASLRSLAAEAGLTLGPVTEANIEQAPELAVVEALTGTAAFQNEAANILESAKVNENGIRFIYTTGSRPADYSGDQGNLGGAYEAASRDDGGSSQTDTGKSGGSKEEGARRANQRCFGQEAGSAFGKTICGVQDRSAERITQIFWNSESSRPPPENPSHKMKPTPSQPHEKKGSANKPKPSQNESEPIEPHELASQMTSDQLGELIRQLMESKRPPAPKTP
jgi:hypothetical protein